METKSKFKKKKSRVSWKIGPVIELIESKDGDGVAKVKKYSTEISAVSTWMWWKIRQQWWHSSQKYELQKLAMNMTNAIVSKRGKR